MKLTNQIARCHLTWFDLQLTTGAVLAPAAIVVVAIVVVAIVVMILAT